MSLWQKRSGSQKSRPAGAKTHKVISVRMEETLLAQLDALSAKTNRSRNELINLLLRAAVDIVRIDGE